MVALDMVATSTLPLHVITTGPMNTASSCLELKCIVGSRVFNAENVYLFRFGEIVEATGGITNELFSARSRMRFCHDSADKHEFVGALAPSSLTLPLGFDQETEYPCS